MTTVGSCFVGARGMLYAGARRRLCQLGQSQTNERWGPKQEAPRVQEKLKVAATELTEQLDV